MDSGQMGRGGTLNELGLPTETTAAITLATILQFSTEVAGNDHADPRRTVQICEQIDLQKPLDWISIGR
jgi:urease alpha subunit